MSLFLLMSWCVYMYICACVHKCLHANLHYWLEKQWNEVVRIQRECDLCCAPWYPSLSGPRKHRPWWSNLSWFAGTGIEISLCCLIWFHDGVIWPRHPVFCPHHTSFPTCSAGHMMLNGIHLFKFLSPWVSFNLPGDYALPWNTTDAQQTLLGLN